MRERIQKLREATLNARPRISNERARLVTECYRQAETQSLPVPVQRARVFQQIMANKALYVGEGELIVGERGPAPAAVPTYPEICVHSMEDLDTLSTREKIPYHVDGETRREHETQILPFWRHRAQRDRLFRELPREWHAAYAAGIFTEFQEQRAPGHTALGDKIYRKGFLDLKNDVRRSMERLDYLHDPQAQSKKEELQAMDMAVDGLLTYAARYADRLESMAVEAADPERRKELEQMARNCRAVPAHPPETFWQALQYYWFVHVGVITELNPWDSFNPGRLDQHLFPFYQREVAAGTLTRDDARELLQAFWIKFHNHPAPPKVGVTASESGTYTDFALINVGGVTANGADGANDVTYLILDVVEEMRLVQPSSMVQLSKRSPDRLIKRAARIIRTGFGQPSIFNTDAIVQELVRQGKSLEDARCGGASGCVESGAFGKEAYFLSGYFNIPKVLEITLNNGMDPRTKEIIGIETGDPRSFQTFEELFTAFTRQLAHFVDIKIRGNNVVENLYARYMPVPFLSLVIEDCIENAIDYQAGGPRYNTTYIQGVGLGTITDCLAAIRFNVYDTKRVGMDDLLKSLAANFSGCGELRQWLLEDSPKYGNDDDRADELAKRTFEAYFACVNGQPNARGGVHRINMLPTTVHVYFGSITGALPDGREGGTALSEGISPVQGADRKGPTAALRSAAKIDHIKTGGTLLNQKFTPQILADDEGIAKLAQLVRGYFCMDGHHVQFNVVTKETLLDAQKHPEKHRDLIVRVAGYSDYFVNLNEELQNEIIHRTEHRAF